MARSLDERGTDAAVKAVADHYRNLLASRYTWTFGQSFEAKVEEQKAIISAAGFRPAGHVIDLGCGSGCQTMAVAELGASRVYAIDLNELLLGELDRRRADQPITLLRGDLTEFRRMVDQPVSTIICMGDTLTHLAGEDQVRGLFVDAAEALTPGGLIVLSWRDLSHVASPAQLIPVRSTDDRIMLCCLEDGGSRVVVQDVVYERTDGGWTFQSSAYSKLKLPVALVKQMLDAAGLSTEHECTAGAMAVVAARRP